MKTSRSRWIWSGPSYHLVRPWTRKAEAARRTDCDTASAHTGQALLPTVRLLTGARQAWPREQRHQAGWLEVAIAVAGVAPRLRVGFHSRAILGNSLASEFVTLTLRLPQKGQDAFVRTVGATSAYHEWSGPRGHLHQTVFFDHRMTCRGMARVDRAIFGGVTAWPHDAMISAVYF